MESLRRVPSPGGIRQLDIMKQYKCLLSADIDFASKKFGVVWVVSIILFMVWTTS